MTKALFRKEALEATATRSLGEPFVEYPLSLSKAALIASGVLISAILAACVFQIQDRQVVAGYTLPQSGVIDVFAERPGVVETQLKLSGALVRKSEPIATLRSEAKGQGGYVTARAAKAGVERLSSLELSAADDERGQARLKILSLEMEQSRSAVQGNARSFQIASELVRTKTDKFERARMLSMSGYVSKDFLTDREADLLEANYRRQQLEQDRTNLQLEYQTRKARLSEELANEREVGRQLQRQILDAVEHVSNTSEAVMFDVRSPVTGFISAVNFRPGQFVDGSRPILSVVPKDTAMWCVLMVSARELSFIRTGQNVSIRYAAYPYQYFGSHPGVVRQIETVPASVQVANSGKEARYRVFVEPRSRMINTSRGARSITPGMEVEAVVWLDNRTFISWLVRPLMEVFAARTQRDF